MSSPVLPGRLGSPDMSLRDDPRADPRMIAAMEPFGLGERAAPAPVDASSSIEDLLEYVSEAEQGFEALFGAVVGRHARCRGRRAQRRGHQGSRRQRRDRLHPPSCRSSRCAARRAASARRRHGHARGCRRDVRQSARRARGGRPRRRRGRVPQRRRQARAPPVPGRPQRLCRGAAVGHRQQGGPRHRQADRRGRVRRGEPHLGDDAAGQARRIARPHRRRLRDVPVHLEHLGGDGWWLPRCSRTTGTSSTSR